jgi:hypothetical protein
MTMLTTLDGLVIFGPFAALVAIIAIGFAVKGLKR